MAIRAIENKEVWYWPERDELLHCLEMSSGQYLMFFSEYKYYYYTISKKRARAHGLKFLGKI